MRKYPVGAGLSIPRQENLGKKKNFHTETRRHGEEEMNENEIGGIVALNFGEILMKDGISHIIKWQTSSNDFFISPCLRVSV